MSAGLGLHGRKRTRLRGIFARLAESYAYPDLQEAAALIGLGEEMPSEYNVSRLSFS